MESYVQMKRRHQEEFNNFPCFFAWSDSQFDEGLKKLVVKNAKEELYHGGNGMFYRKSDAHKLSEMIKRNGKELDEALRNDDDFLYQAVRYELANHEFCITEEWDDVLFALGLDKEEVFADERMARICSQAEEDYMAKYETE